MKQQSHLPLRSQIEQQQMIGGGEPVQALPAIPPPTPQVSPNSAAVLDVQQAQKRQNLRRKNISSTMMAGAGAAGAASGNPVTTGPGATGAAPSVSSGGTKTG